MTGSELSSRAGLRVAFDATQLLGYTGINVYTRNLARALALEYPQDRYAMLTTYRKMDRVAEHFGPNADALQWGNPFPSPLALGYLLRPVVERAIVQRWRRVAKEYDLVHETDPFHVPHGVPNMVTTVHDLIPLLPEPWVTPATRARIKRKLDAVMKSQTGIIVPSEFVRGEVLRTFEIDPARVHVTYEAAPRHFRVEPTDDAALERLGLDPTRRYFLYVGRIDVRKNIEALVEAYLKLPSEIRRDVDLVLIANGSPKDQADFRTRHLRDRGIIHKLNVSDEDLVSLLNRAVGLAFVSLHEGFGIPLLEAMQCGCPILSSNVTSMPEIAGEAAVLVDPRSVHEIKQGLVRLATDETLRSSLRQAGLERAQEFSWERCARETRVAYESQVARG